MKTLAIIPARMASTRFPGKPLAPLLGLPMIEHVRRRTALSRSLDQVLVATCDPEIVPRALEHGYPVRMVLWDGETVGVDRPGEISRAEKILRQDPWLERYHPDWRRLAP